MELYDMSFNLGRDTESVCDSFEEFFHFESSNEEDDPLDARTADEILEMLYKQMEVFSQSALFADGVRQGLKDQKANGKIHLPEGMSDVQALAKLFAEAGIIITGRDEKKDSTKTAISNWLSGRKHPRHTVVVRENVFRLCFALKFNEKQAAEFFVKCYLDRPFNYRSLREAVYYFCLKNKKSYKTAQDIIARIGDLSVESPVQETRLIEKALNESDDTDAFVRYMILNRSSFEIPSRTIEANLKKLYDECYKKACEEHPEIFSYKAYLDSEGEENNSEAQKHQRKQRIIYPEAMNQKDRSIRMVIASIYRNPLENTEKLYKEDVKKDMSVYQKKDKMRIPNIVNRSMLTHTDSTLFSDDNYREGSNQTIRKALILMNFYQYMAGEHGKNKYTPGYRNERFWDFVENTDELLQECGFIQLYWRNPYDWFFLFCAATSNPLETFRSFSDPSEEPDEQEV